MMIRKDSRENEDEAGQTENAIAGVTRKMDTRDDEVASVDKDENSLIADENLTEDGVEEITVDGVEDDPLATAYDLERGEPLEVNTRQDAPPRLPWRSEVTNAKEFFATEVLYRFDILELEERSQVAGKYCVELKGSRGGVWTLQLGDEIEVTNRREDADTVLTMQQRDFLAIVNGDLNPQLAILAQKVKVFGDLKRAIMFQSLLAPSGE